MDAAIESQKELIEEAFSILQKHMPPLKVARLLSLWQIGEGDYVKEREALFAGETVESLFSKASALAPR